MVASDAMPYRRITYISRADADLPATDVRQILGLAEVLHRRHDLSGVLAYTGRHFFQVIEGLDAEVEDLLIQIRADNRHHDLRILSDEAVRQRIHDRWYSLMVDSLDLVDQVEAAHRDKDVGRERARQLTYRIAAPAARPSLRQACWPEATGEATQTAPVAALCCPAARRCVGSLIRARSDTRSATSTGLRKNALKPDANAVASSSARAKAVKATAFRFASLSFA